MVFRSHISYYKRREIFRPAVKQGIKGLIRTGDGHLDLVFVIKCSGYTLAIFLLSSVVLNKGPLGSLSVL